MFNRLHGEERFKAYDWFRAVVTKESLTANRWTVPELARMATEKLGFQVTVAIVASMMEFAGFQTSS